MRREHFFSPNWLNILQYLLEYEPEVNTVKSVNCVTNVWLLTILGCLQFWGEPFFNFWCNYIAWCECSTFTLVLRKELLQIPQWKVPEPGSTAARRVGKEISSEDEPWAGSTLCENILYFSGQWLPARNTPVIPYSGGLTHTPEIFAESMQDAWVAIDRGLSFVQILAVCGHIPLPGLSLWRWGVKQEEHSCACRSQMEITQHAKESENYILTYTQCTLTLEAIKDLEQP